MEQNSNNTTTNTKYTKREKTLIIIIIITLICTFSGISFGVFELTESLKKDEQISKLQTEIDRLKNKNSTKTSEKTRIKIISSSWSGWSEDYTPKETESYCEISLHEKCVVKTRQYSNAEGKEFEEEVLSFEIESINDDSVDIHTFQVFSDNEKGINLLSDKQDFTIKEGESLKLTTPTMDAGDTFTLTLSKD